MVYLVSDHGGFDAKAHLVRWPGKFKNQKNPAALLSVDRVWEWRL